MECNTRFFRDSARKKRPLRGSTRDRNRFMESALDDFSQYYRDLTDGGYDCVDRIVVNAYFRMGQTSGGMLTWWRALYGDAEQLDTAHLMRMAGRFARRVRAFAKQRGITILNCAPKDKKFEVANSYLGKHDGKPGLFLILVNKGRAPVWEVWPSKNGRLGAIRRKHPMPFVNHYAFHIWDPEWGHIQIRMSGHPPFGAQIILNGHEFVACMARKANIEFHQQGNCFVAASSGARLAQIADTLSQPEIAGQLRQLCNRWIYSTCLIFGLNLEEQERSAFQYQYSNYQLEYSRNLWFQRGTAMWEVLQGLVDRNRRLLNLKVVKTIFGFKHRPRVKQLRKNRWGVEIETPAYDVTVFHIHYGKVSLKIYSKGESVLRIEVMIHNAAAVPFHKDLDYFCKFVEWMKQAADRFLNLLHCVDVCFLSDDTLENLGQPAQLGNTRVGGIDLALSRMRLAVQAVLALCTSPNGFKAGELAATARSLGGPSVQYTVRQAAYDIRKLRAKNILEKPPRSNRYRASANGLRALATVVLLRDKVIRPLLASECRLRRGPPPKQSAPIDHHYRALQREMRELFTTIGIAA